MTEKTRTIKDDLDELQTKTERLMKLLNDRQPGLMAWNLMLKNAIETIKDTIERII